MFHLWRAMAGKPVEGRQEEQMAIANRVESVVGSKEDAGGKIMRHAGLLSGQLQLLRTRMYPPKSEKILRPFLTNEVSKLTSIPDSTLKLMSTEGRGPVPSRLENNHRVYTLAQINELRGLFAMQKPADALRIPSSPSRRRASPGSCNSQLQGRQRKNHDLRTSLPLSRASRLSRPCIRFGSSGISVRYVWCSARDRRWVK